MSAFDVDGPGRSEDGLFGVAANPSTAAVVVIPVPFQATTSYRRGTRDGPAAVREASVQVDLMDLETGAAWRSGIAMLDVPAHIRELDAVVEEDALAVIAAGGVTTPALRRAAERVDAAGAEVDRWVYAQARAVLERGAVPGVLGGDHASPFGNVQAVAQAYPGVGILHVDAHADLRVAYEGFPRSHASIFYNVLSQIPEVANVVSVGVRDVGHGELERIEAWKPRLRVHRDPEIAYALAGGTTWRHLAESFVETLPEHVYVSLDIDGLDPSLCPHTGTPVPGGLSWHQICVLLRVLVEAGHSIVGFDLCEVSPGPGPFAESWDAIVGARLLYKLCGWAAKTRGGVARS